MPPSSGPFFHGFLFECHDYAVLQLVGTVGAVIMPHNLYLHSGICKERQMLRTLCGEALCCSWCHRVTSCKNLKEETVLCKIGNVETYLKWTFLSVENAITRSCSLAKKGKCKALPVCQANFEILKVWIAFLYQVPQVLTHAVWRTEGNYEFGPTRGTHATMQLDLGALR